jgi:hypothetical protein
LRLPLRGKKYRGKAPVGAKTGGAGPDSDKEPLIPFSLSNASNMNTRKGLLSDLVKA